MGEMMRRYWLPALTSTEIPEPDCPPVRVRLLGEDLVAFRDTDGRVGLLAENCAHRRASLFYGRNEECGLRCIYHGWKYDVEGNIVDTPAEPDNSMLKHHVKHRAYPCHEVNGLIYTYMGPKEKMPLVPNLPWFTLPAENVRIIPKLYNECNWLQGLEGDCDPAHSPYLHWRGDRVSSNQKARRNVSPDIDLEHTSWGVRAAAIFHQDEKTNLVRTNVFVMPCIGNIPNGKVIDGKLDGWFSVYQVPADDYNVWRFNVHCGRTLPPQINEEPQAGPDFRKFANRANDYLIDREAQRSGRVYCGIDASNNTQDACVTESMGPIIDRSQEHLGVTDAHIAAMRQFLLKALADFEAGSDPPGLAYEPAQNQFDDLWFLSSKLPAADSWRDPAVVERVTTHRFAAR
jgi:nitrite reductase/ring-hydroxylating ferredoxin subunit